MGSRYANQSISSTRYYVTQFPTATAVCKHWKRSNAKNDKLTSIYFLLKILGLVCSRLHCAQVDICARYFCIVQHHYLCKIFVYFEVMLTAWSSAGVINELAILIFSCYLRFDSSNNKLQAYQSSVQSKLVLNRLVWTLAPTNIVHTGKISRITLRGMSHCHMRVWSVPLSIRSHNLSSWQSLLFHYSNTLSHWKTSIHVSLHFLARP